MRIGIDVRVTQFDNDQGRGIGSYVASMLEGLLAEPLLHDYVLVVMPDKPLPRRIELLVQAGRCTTVALATRPIDDNSFLGRLPRLWRLHYRLIEREHRRGLTAVVRNERFDVIHIAVPFAARMFSSVQRNSRRRYRVVATAYDLIPLLMSDKFFPPGAGRARFAYERQLRTYRSADTVVAISQSAANDFAELAGVEPARLQVVHCGVAREFMPMHDQARLDRCRERYRLAPRFFLFCSGVGPQKNRRRVVEAFGRFLAGRRHSDEQLIFVGPESEHDVGELKLAAFEAGLNREQFRLLGFVPIDDLITLFSGALALVTPSIHEGFGLPAAQAMQSGTPVIAANRSSHPEVVGQAGLLVDPYDIDAIAAAMTRLADDTELRQALSAFGLRRSEQFSLAAQTEGLLSVYERGH